jgi:hypothetical protein
MKMRILLMPQNASPTVGFYHFDVIFTQLVPSLIRRVIVDVPYTFMANISSLILEAMYVYTYALTEYMSNAVQNYFVSRSITMALTLVHFRSYFVSKSISIRASDGSDARILSTFP